MCYSVETEVEYESCSGHIWCATARGMVMPAEPCVGIPHAYIENVQLFWANGKEFSKAAYKRVPKAWWETIRERLATRQ